MAQIFKSKDLTFSIPEKETGAHPNCGNASNFVICFYSPCAFWTTQACTCTFHTPYPPHCTLTPHHTTFQACTDSEKQMGPVENEISKITDAETLKTLNDKLLKSLEEVKARQAELSKSK